LSCTLPSSPCSTLFPYTTLFRSRPDLGLDLLRHLTAGLKVGDVALYPVDVVTFALAGGLPLADLLLIRIHAGRHHPIAGGSQLRSEEHTSELQSRENLVCRLLLE